MAIAYLHGRELGRAICDTLDIDPMLVNRIIVDCNASGDAVFPKVYIEMIGDRRLLDIQWTDALKGADVITTKEASNETL